MSGKDKAKYHYNNLNKIDIFTSFFNVTHKY